MIKILYKHQDILMDTAAGFVENFMTPTTIAPRFISIAAVQGHSFQKCIVSCANLGVTSNSLFLGKSPFTVDMIRMGKMIELKMAPW